MNIGRDVYVVDVVRTPVGKAQGLLSTVRPDDLLAHCFTHLLSRVDKIEPANIGDIIVGCAMPEAEQGMNVARLASLLAGIPEDVPAMTINRFCSSGLQAVAIAAQQIALGDEDIVIAGGTESMSMVPIGGNKYTLNPNLFFANKHPEIALSMGITAENVAKKWSINRESQDKFALESHARALKAQQEKRFADEIVSYKVEHYLPNEGSAQVSVKSYQLLQDQGPRKDTSLEALRKLKPIFARGGTVTAGNTSQMSDGAGAMLLVSEDILTKYDLQPLAKFCGFSVAGVAPEIMGIGPIAAVPKLLSKLQLKKEDLGWIELNEAFAAQTLAVIKELELDPAKVNPLGGAIALGHPLGATGIIRCATLLHGMRAQNLKYGLVTMCVGTGMGAAGIFEAL